MIKTYRRTEIYTVMALPTNELTTILRKAVNAPDTATIHFTFDPCDTSARIEWMLSVTEDAPDE